MVPNVKAFWPEAGNTLHIDGWREVNKVNGHSISVAPHGDETPASTKKLFFLNLGGYTCDILEEQHYTVLTVQTNRAEAIVAGKKTVFFKANSLKGTATAHIDEKYGVDVDNIYQIEDMLAPAFKERYRIVIGDGPELPEDKIHLGYFKLDKIR